MKKVALILALVMVVLAFGACGTTNQATSEEIAKVVLNEENGVLTAVDTISSPYKNGGVSIEIKKGTDGYAKFVKTDKNGNATKEYFIFDYSKNTMEEYYYVSMMGTGFYYTFDLEKNELIKVEDKDHNDTTAKTKESGHWDGSQEKCIEAVNTLEEYCTNTFDLPIKNLVTAE